MIAAILARDGDHAAWAALVARFDSYATTLAHIYFIKGGDVDDVYAEAMVGLMNAVRGWDRNGAADFGTFARLCMRRQVMSEMTGARRQKRRSHMEAVSLSKPIRDATGDDAGELGDRLVAHASLDPASQAERMESIREAADFVARGLTPVEQSALDGVAAGRSYEEISSATGNSQKSIDNALQRVRRKFGKYRHETGLTSTTG